MVTAAITSAVPLPAPRPCRSRPDGCAGPRADRRVLRPRQSEGDVCCGGYDECHGSCGGAGCGAWDGGAALCCANTIRAAGVECEGPADVGCLIPRSLQPSTSAVPLPAPTAVPVPAPTAVPLPAPTTVPLPAPTAVPVHAPTAVPLPAPTAMPVPAPTAVPIPAPTVEFCGLGNPKGNVCCGGYDECYGSCGGAGCGSWDGGAALCCASTIRSAGVACEDPADVGCMIPAPSAVPIPVPTTAPLPAPTTVPVPAPSAVPLPVPTMRWHHSPRRPSCRSPRRPSSFAGSATRRGASAAAAMTSATAAAAAPGAAHGMAAPRSAARAPFAVQASRARTRRTWAA